MPRKSQFTDEQIIRALRDVDAGAKPADVCRRLGVTEKSFYRWRQKFGGMEVNEAKRLRALEDENAKLKKLLADQMLDNAALKAVLEKKMVKPATRRRVVGYLQQAFGFSERRACRVVGLCRATARYVVTRVDPPDLVKDLLKLAADKPRYGYRFLHRKLRRKGYRYNHKRIYRLYREHRLGLRTRRRTRSASSPREVPARPTAARQQWAMDFVSDHLASGRRFRALTVVDEFSRRSPGILVETSISGERVARFDELAATTGLPERSSWTTAQSSSRTLSTSGRTSAA